MTRACQRADRDPRTVRLVVVTKTVGPEIIAALARCGIVDVAENRIQVAAPKIATAPAGLHWHFVGHLQSNKAARAARLFATIHSIDSVELARKVAAAARRSRAIIDVLLQVNVAGEARKHGMAPDEVREAAGAIGQIEGLRLVGLMTIAPLAGGMAAARETFRDLRGLRDELVSTGTAPLTDLSMGMSDDFEVAIEEGATVIRVGRAVFAGLS